MVVSNISEFELRQLRIIYPKAMDHFDKWLILYRLASNTTFTYISIPSKFEMLPFALQMGIIIEYYQHVFMNGDISMIQYKGFKESFENSIKEINSAIV